MRGALIMKRLAKVVDIIYESPDVITINFLVDGAVMPFTAGQYITAYFDQTGFLPGKAYSLSSSPDEPTMSITVKKIGLFSGLLHDLKVDDKFTISKPYGFFNLDIDRPIVAIAAGVGISPMYSIIKDKVDKSDTSLIELFYCNKTEQDIIFRTRLERIRQLSVNHFITKQPNTSCIPRRFLAKRDIKSTGNIYYICGAQQFVADIWRQLIDMGVDVDLISTETFFEAS